MQERREVRAGMQQQGQDQGQGKGMRHMSHDQARVPRGSSHRNITGAEARQAQGEGHATIIITWFPERRPKT